MKDIPPVVTADQPATEDRPTIYTTLDSPLGELLLVGEESPDAPGGVTLTALSVPDQRGGVAVRPAWRRAPEAFGEAVRQLRAYFAGELTHFDLDLASRGSDFRARVWRALEDIPYGTTTTYGALAARIGAPRTAARALGTAVGANPLLVLRPCHRVIGASGALTGYAGGLDRKRQLLSHEGALPAG